MNDCEIIVCYGGAKPGDFYLLSNVVAVDEEIFAVLEKREKLKRVSQRGKRPWCQTS
jgi:hypothetical protein